MGGIVDKRVFYYSFIFYVLEMFHSYLEMNNFILHPLTELSS